MTTPIRTENSHANRDVIAMVFLLGAVGTLSQVYLTREALAVLEGNELTVAVLLCAWLLGVGLGALLARALASTATAGIVFALPGAAILGFCAGVYLLRSSHSVFGVLPGHSASPWQTLGIVMASVVPAGTVVGIALPLLAGLISTRSGRAAGEAFSWDALGSVSAGVLLSFVLLPHTGPFVAANLLLVAWVYQMGRARKLRFPQLLVAVLIACTPLVGLTQRIENATTNTRWSAAQPHLEKVSTHESRYQHLALGRLAEQYTLFGNGLPLMSFPNPYEDAPFVHVALSQRPRPESVLLLSDRAQWLAPYVQRHAIPEIVCCALDPAVGDVIGEALGDFSPALPDTIESVYSDPRAYLSRLPAEKKFDLILVDQPDPSTALLNRLYTYEFYQTVDRHLGHGGILVFTVTGTPNYFAGETGRFGASLYRTLRSVFSDVLVLPGTQWTFFATNTTGILQPDVDALMRNWNEAELDIPEFPPELLSLYYDRSTLEILNTHIANTPNAILNTDARPYAYASQLLLWLQRGGIRITPSSWVAGGGGFTALLLFLAWLAFRRRCRQRESSAALSASLLLGGTGLLSIGVELLLLTVYQSRVGCLYQYVGLFFGVFMLGLALGGFCGLRLAEHEDSRATMMLMKTDAALIAATLATPIVAWILPSGAPLGTAMVLLGWLGLVAFLAGLEFPLVAAVLGADRPDGTRLTALLEGVDHIGGAMGAPLVGLILLPWLGLVYTCLILGVGKVIVLTFVAVPVAPRRSTGKNS